MHSAVRTMVPELPPPNVCNEYLRKYRETDSRAEISGGRRSVMDINGYVME